MISIITSQERAASKWRRGGRGHCSLLTSCGTNRLVEMPPIAVQPYLDGSRVHRRSIDMVVLIVGASLQVILEAAASAASAVGGDLDFGFSDF